MGCTHIHWSQSAIRHLSQHALGFKLAVFVRAKDKSNDASPSFRYVLPSDDAGQNPRKDDAKIRNKLFSAKKMRIFLAMIQMTTCCAALVSSENRTVDEIYFVCG